MNPLKKFWIIFLSFLPFGAGAIPLLWTLGLTAAATLVGATYRYFSPVNVAESMEFFSTCWTCEIFSDILTELSKILPKLYNTLGELIIPLSIALSAIWFTWRITDNFLNGNKDKPWSIADAFGKHLLKLAFVSALLVAPLPRMITDVVIEPIFSIGLSINRAFVYEDNFDKCVITTTIADPNTTNNRGAFSTKLINHTTCQIANIHQLTGAGMTVGWVLMNMSLDPEYAFIAPFNVPIFPNLLLLAFGLVVIGIFVTALLPIPLYLLEVFVKLTMDFIMLPLMLLSWLFDGWAISLKGAGTTIRGIINDVISASVGIAIVGIFISFSTMFLNAAFGQWNGMDALLQAFSASDSQGYEIIKSAIEMKNDSIITILLMGLFLAMFMVSTPALIKALFNVQISTKYYDSAKKDAKTLWNGTKKIWESLKK